MGIKDSRQNYRKSNRILATADKERIAWQLVISTLKDSILQYNLNLTERSNEFREAGKIVREQHNKQLEQHQLQIGYFE